MQDMEKELMDAGLDTGPVQKKEETVKRSSKKLMATMLGLTAYAGGLGFGGRSGGGGWSSNFQNMKITEEQIRQAEERHKGEQRKLSAKEKARMRCEARGKKWIPKKKKRK